MTTTVPASLVSADVATQAELDAATAVNTTQNGRLTTLELPGRVTQTVYTFAPGLATGSVLIPYDDTIPQITEGDAYMTATITPRAVGSILRVDVVWHGCASVASRLTVALFQDSTANALAATSISIDAANAGAAIPLTFYQVVASTAATVFRVRAGLNTAGTVSFNGSAGARVFGGVSASSITIAEIAG